MSKIIKINSKNEKEIILDIEEFNNKFLKDKVLEFKNIEIDSFEINKIIYDYTDNEDKEKDKEVNLSLLFENCSFQNNFIIDLPNDEDFTFKKISIINKAQKKSFENLKLGDFNIDKLYFKNYDINNFDLFNLDFIEDSKILFEDIVTKTLSIKKISQDSKYIQFHNVKIEKRLFFERIELKNTYFNDFNLESSSIKLIKTSFIDAHLNSVHWGKDLSRIKAKKDIFRQLKFVNDSAGNYIEGNRFFEQEMKTHQNDISKDKSKILEKFTLYLNKEISNFGQNWLLALTWIITLSYMVFLIQENHILTLQGGVFLFVMYAMITCKWMDVIINNEKTKHDNQILYSSFIILLLTIYLYTNNNFISFSKLFSLKPPKEYDFLIAMWVWHKILIAIPLYHFTISLRRLTKR